MKLEGGKNDAGRWDAKPQNGDKQQTTTDHHHSNIQYIFVSISSLDMIRQFYFQRFKNIVRPSFLLEICGCRDTIYCAKKHSKSLAASSPISRNHVCFSSMPSTSTASSTRSSSDCGVDHNRDDRSDMKTHNTLIAHYQSLVKAGTASNDEFQVKALAQLDELRNQVLSLDFYTRKSEKPKQYNNNKSASSSALGDAEEIETSYPYFLNKISNLFSTATAAGADTTSVMHSIISSLPSLKGTYLHGGVGCGKTFCMNLFYDSLPEHMSKQKVHFHSFMLNVHKQMHEAKMVQKIEGDVLPHIIQNTIQDGIIICFDEFQVTDVADALILRRLFTGLLDEGAVIIATSNRPPKDLYLNGLQRDLFLPFIDLLEEKLHIVSMWESEVDYRLIQGENKARGVYFVGEESKDNFETAFKKLTKGSIISPTKLSTQGRFVDVPKASVKYGVARFSFDDLCRQARGAADYLIIGDQFHTVFIEDVPSLTMNDINLVRRFIIFVDSMYECQVKLIIHAATGPNEIFKVDLENEFCDEAFAFDRTRSRLEEMGSDEYLKRRWVGSAGGSKD